MIGQIDIFQSKSGINFDWELIDKAIIDLYPIFIY